MKKIDIKKNSKKKFNAFEKMYLFYETKMQEKGEI